MKVLLLGTPGIGKGIQAQFITTAFGIPQTSTDDMLRAAIRAGIPLGLETKKVTNEGGLAHDDIIIGMMKGRIAQNDCKNDSLFGGFPRALAQAEVTIGAGMNLDAVVKIDVPDSVTIDRMSNRRVHLTSDRAYHVTYNPPKVEDKDDVIGEDLIQCDDDKEETVRKRLAVYREQIGVLADFYSKPESEHTPKYTKVDGTQVVEAVKVEVLEGSGK